MVGEKLGAWNAARAQIIAARCKDCAADRPKRVLAFRVTRFVFAAALLLTLSSCGKSRPRADLVFINGAEPESIDPAIVTDQVGMRIASALFEGLCRIDEAGKPHPGMAERWDVSPDRKTYTFHLRPNATWSDGVAFTTQDFLYSWKRVLSA
jgi:oligopeptide transport system substrate-binding protein